MVAPDNDPSNVNQYTGYNDNTGVPTPLETEGERFDENLHDLLVREREEGSNIHPLYIGSIVYKSANQLIPNNTFTLATFGAEDHDTDGFHDNAINPGRLTVPTGQAGRYRLWAAAAWATTAAAGMVQMRLYKNVDSAFGTVGLLTRFNSHNDYNLQQITYPAVSLAEGDYVTLAVYQDSGAGLNLVGGSEFETAFGLVKIS